MPRKRNLWQIFGTVTRHKIAKKLLHWLDLDEYPYEMYLTDEVHAVVSLPFPDVWTTRTIKAGGTWKIGDNVPNGVYEVYAKTTAANQSVTLNGAGSIIYQQLGGSYWYPSFFAMTLQGDTDTAYYDPAAAAEVRYTGTPGVTMRILSTTSHGFQMTDGEYLTSTIAYAVRYRRIA